MGRNEITVDLFGREETFAYSEEAVGYAVLALRLVMGWTMFYAGVTKLLDPGWTAAGYLSSIPAANPFSPLWAAIATDWLWLVDPLNAWGLTLIGLGLLTGAFLRFSAFWGAVAMLFYWASSFPLQHSILIDDHVVYALLLFGLGAVGAGRILGVDAYIEETAVVERRPWLRYLLG
ncbi:MAG: DoxX family membrane protein [Candidatus Nanohaloarchaea archaeon]|nr:DoxX family membrane protein [Candidatus Nanohaloarchaea archaeon]